MSRSNLSHSARTTSHSNSARENRSRESGASCAGCLCGIALAVLACLLMTTQYQGIATIEVQKTDASQTSLLSDAAPLIANADDLKTDIATHKAVLQSPNVTLAVVHDLNLQSEAPFAFRPTILGFLTGTNDRIRDEMRQELPLDQAPFSRARILAIFKKKLKVENTPDTRLLTVEYLSPNRQRAADIANAIVREYVTYEARSLATADAQQWLSEQLADLKNNVEDSQGRLADFEQKTGLNGMALGAMGEGGGAGNATHIPVLDSLDVLNQQLVAAQTDRIAKEAVYHLTNSQNPDVVASLAGSPDSRNPASEIAVSDAALEFLRNLRLQQSALRVSYADMLSKYGPNNQRLVETKSQLDSLNSQIAEELTRINENAHQQFLLASRKEAGIQQAFTRQQEKAGALNASSVNLQALTQQASRSRQLYDSLYARLKQVNIQAALRATNISVADPARPPAKPKRPDPPLYIAIGLLAGLFAGVSSAFVREHLDDTVTVAMQLQWGGLPMLGNIPSSREVGSRSKRSGLLTTTSESSPLVNAPSPLPRSRSAGYARRSWWPRAWGISVP